MKVTAVIVTFNRLVLLQKTLDYVRMTPLVTHIIVVNNGSTDGTTEWLDTQADLEVIHQDNVGGSGGFYTGMKAAYEGGSDWIWCMDDDVFPRPDCLNFLIDADMHGVGILCPRRIMGEEVFVTECRYLNLIDPFSSLHLDKVEPYICHLVSIQGMVFEGPLIKRSTIERIGYPNKDLFIFYDDTDYAYRAVLAGLQVLYVPNALMYKERFYNNDTWAERQRKKKWKRFYQVRNGAYFNHHYGKNFLIRYLRPLQETLGYIFLAFFTAPFTKAYSWRDIPRFWRMYLDGIHERLGKL